MGGRKGRREGKIIMVTQNCLRKSRSRWAWLCSPMIAAHVRWTEEDSESPSENLSQKGERTTF